MSDKKILITKTRASGNRMVRADTKDGLGNGTWINAERERQERIHALKAERARKRVSV